MTQNPPPEDSGNCVGSRWRTIEAGIRTGQTWFPAFFYFLSSPSFDDESVVTMVKSFVDHARHLMAYPTGGNWLTMEANGLFHIGAMLPELKEAAEWRETAMQRLYAELDNQVYPDGAQIELATGYHQVSLRNFVMPVELAKLNDIPIPDDYLAKLERMYHYDLYAAMPDGRLPDLNDGGWVDVRPYCEQGYGYYPHRTDMQWMATDGAEGTPPDHDSYIFPYAGHLIMRSGWDRDARYLLFDAGPFGYSHQHEDKLHFVLYAYGRVHVTDPGNYAYDSSQWRAYHISAYAHNTIIVDARPQNRRGFDRTQYVVKEPMAGNWISTEAYDYAVGVYSDPAEGEVTEGYGPERDTSVTHIRQIVFVKPLYWVVFDTLVPRDDEPHTYESPFHLEAEDAEVNPSTNSVLTHNANASSLAIIPVPREGLTVEIVSGQEEPVVQGWAGAGGYEVRPIPTPTYRQSARGLTHFAYVFCPIQLGSACPVAEVRSLDVQADQGTGVGVEIRFADGSAQLVAVARGASELTVDGQVRKGPVAVASRP